MVAIYVVTHKEVNLTLPPCYKIIAVGSFSDSEKSSCYLRDNIGDNISRKNPNYCELTAHYWIWKNAQEDIVGLCHYRRFFTTHILSNSKKHVLYEQKIQQVFNHGYDIILPYHPVARRTVRDIACNYLGLESDWDTMRSVIAEKEPEYIAEFDALAKRHSNYPCNMLICHKELFDRYSEWLFGILFELEKRIDISGYDIQKARIFGYFSERLLEVWVKKNNLKIKHYRCLNTEKKYDFKSNILNILSVIIERFRR